MTFTDHPLPDKLTIEDNLVFFLGSGKMIAEGCEDAEEELAELVRRYNALTSLRDKAAALRGTIQAASDPFMAVVGQDELSILLDAIAALTKEGRQ